MHLERLPIWLRLHEALTFEIMANSLNLRRMYGEGSRSASSYHVRNWRPFATIRKGDSGGIRFVHWCSLFWNPGHANAQNKFARNLQKGAQDRFSALVEVLKKFWIFLFCCSLFSLWLTDGDWLIGSGYNGITSVLRSVYTQLMYSSTYVILDPLAPHSDAGRHARKCALCNPDSARILKYPIRYLGWACGRRSLRRHRALRYVKLLRFTAT